MVLLIRVFKLEGRFAEALAAHAARKSNVSFPCVGWDELSSLLVNSFGDFGAILSWGIPASDSVQNMIELCLGHVDDIINFAPNLISL